VNKSGRIQSIVLTVCIVLGLSGWTAAAVAADKPEHGKLSPYGKLAPVSQKQVQINDEFWNPRLKTCREVTQQHCFDQCEKTGRISNFDKAAGKMEGKFEGPWSWTDSDVYKIVEGAAYQLGVKHDPKLDKFTDELIAKFAAAQQPDGYLFTYLTIHTDEERFKHIHWDGPAANRKVKARSELYCMGHLIEAGATHYQMTGKRNLLDVACKLADHVDSIFGPGKRREVASHPEIELALIKLYSVTGEKRYLKLAQFFIDQRGNAEGHELYGVGSVDYMPVRKMSEMRGHAVCAMYLCIGMADLYLETGDKELLAALNRLWESLTHRKMYIHGGAGNRARKRWLKGAGYTIPPGYVFVKEGFGPDYWSDNYACYSETCAQIGFLLWAHRMSLIEPKAEYADVMERVLYNGFLSGLSLDGKHFFYQNRLHVSVSGHPVFHRKPWYGCACCPSNVVRVYPQLGRFIYATDNKSLFVNLYIGGKSQVKLGGTDVSLTQETRYPWDGKVELTVAPKQAVSFDLNLRIPGWCRDKQTPGGLYFTKKALFNKVTATVNGKAVDCSKLVNGYLRLNRKWRPGDKIVLNLPMDVQRVYAHEKVKQDRGRVALQRGPLVYCLEAVDHKADVNKIALPNDAKLTAEHQPDLLGGVTVIRGKATVNKKPVDLKAIPYYAWSNRGEHAMIVWMLEASK